MAENWQPLSVLLERQQEVATRQQLLGQGIDDKTISRRIRDGDWQRLLPAVHLLTNKPVGTEQRRIAAALYVDGPSQVTGLAALNWYGFRYAPTTDRVHLLVPHERRCRSTGFLIVQRTLELDADQRVTDLYAVVSPARAVIDACRLSGNLESSRSIMSEAVQSRFTSLEALEGELRRAKRSRTAIARRTLEEIIDGVRSLPEAELREFAARSTIIPQVLWNPRLVTPDGECLPSPDGLIPDAWLAIEVDSREHHSSGAGWERTLARHNKLAEHGIDSLHVLPIEVRREPRRVLRQWERTYLVRMRNPPTVNVTIVQQGAQVGRQAPTRDPCVQHVSSA